MEEVADCRCLIQQNVDYNLLIGERMEDSDLIDEMEELMTETMCSNQRSIRVAGNLFPASVVQSRIMKLTAI